MNRRLLVVADSLAGGLGQSAVSQAEWFGARGWEIATAAPKGEANAIAAPGHRGIEIPRTVRDVVGVRRAIRQLRTVRQEFAPRVTHCHGARSLAITRLSGGPVPFVTLHGLLETSSDPFGYARLRRLGLPVVASFTAKAFTAEPGSIRGWKFMPHASNRLAVLERLGPPQAPMPTFLWLGRLDEPKRPDLFVRAMALLSQRRPDAHGVMAGSGPLEEHVTKLIRSTAAPVEMLGHRTDVGELLDQAWALALFSHFEAVTFSVQEAMWAGRAVVSSPLPGVKWLVGADGFLVDEEEAAAAAFEKLCERQFAAQLGAAAADRVRSLLHPEDPWPTYAREYASRI